MKVVVTTGAIRRAKFQSNRQIVNQSNTQLYTGQMHFLSPNTWRENKHNWVDCITYSAQVKTNRSTCNSWQEKLTINTTNELLQRTYSQLNPRLSKRVVVLNAVEQLREAPETVGFQLLPTGLGQVGDAEQRNVSTYTNSQSHCRYLTFMHIFRLSLSPF